VDLGMLSCLGKHVAPQASSATFSGLWWGPLYGMLQHVKVLSVAERHALAWGRGWGSVRCIAKS